MSNALAVFRKVINSDMSVVLVVPLGEHGKFWPSVMPDGRHATKGVYALKVFKTRMVWPAHSKHVSILTDSFSNYLAIGFNGMPNQAWGLPT